MKEMTISLGSVDPVLFFGTNNTQLNLLREYFPDVRFLSRGTELKLHGTESELAALQLVLMRILREIQVSGHVSIQRFSEIIETIPKAVRAEDANGQLDAAKTEVLVYGPNNTRIIAKTQGQHEMVHQAMQNDILFCIGPAGTGKTYTAVALAVRAFKEKEVRKIVLVRPAVEAGESLGFLPGDLKEKIDPYLRPLYDALEDMIPPEKLAQYLEKNIIEIVPLAYMRGRTLNHSFIILDEAQNATEAQLKMFLTRMGTGSKIIVTGDVTQIDLPKSQKSGLIQGAEILQGIKGIAFVRLQPTDVLRHRLIRKILEAYDNV